VNAAKAEPDGLGVMLEDDARSGTFRMAEGDRTKDRDTERLLLIATVEELLSHEIALRESGFLVFPSQLTKEPPPRNTIFENEVIYTFDGPVLTVYATLIVRLSHSGVFERKDMWQNGAAFTVRGGIGTCGVSLQHLQEGRAQLTLFFDPVATVQSRYHLDDYVNAHLNRRALAETIVRTRVFRCTNEACREDISNNHVTKRRQLGYATLRCPICETEVNILDWTERITNIRNSSVVPQIDLNANSQRIKSTVETTLDGKRAVKDFDVFLCYNSSDRPAVKRVGQRLKEHGLLPWLDEWELRPGVPWQPELEEVLSNISAAAVFVGPDGFGPWQLQEIQALLRRFVNSDRPVIPVLLPRRPLSRGSRKNGSKRAPSRSSLRALARSSPADLPKLPLFLENRTWVDFTKLTPDPMERLLWGITGKASQGDSARDSSSSGTRLGE
jgi:aspartate carbamoyltransferase regulatory subunit